MTGRPEVVCSACLGTGHAPLSDGLTAALFIVRERGPMTAKDLRTLMPPTQSPTAANNLLENLRRLGLLGRVRRGKPWFYYDPSGGAALPDRRHVGARGRTAKRGRGMDHVCTRRCLRWSIGLGRRWYYCALTKPVVERAREAGR